MVIGDRNVTAHRALLADEEAAPAPRELGGPPGVGTDVPDATSGFRAYNREAALGLTVVSTFTYTLESLIQAGKSLVAVDHVPVGTNDKTRESRLFWSMSSLRAPQHAGDLPHLHGLRAAAGVHRARRRPGRRAASWPGRRSCGTGSSTATAAATSSRSSSAACCSWPSVQVLALGVLADLLASHRVVSQRTLERVRRIELRARRRAVALRPQARHRGGAPAPGAGRGAHRGARGSGPRSRGGHARRHGRRGLTVRRRRPLGRLAALGRRCTCRPPVPRRRQRQPRARRPRGRRAGSRWRPWPPAPATDPTTPRTRPRGRRRRRGRAPRRTRRSTTASWRCRCAGSADRGSAHGRRTTSRRRSAATPAGRSRPGSPCSRHGGISTSAPRPVRRATRSRTRVSTAGWRAASPRREEQEHGERGGRLGLLGQVERHEHRRQRRARRGTA